MQNENTRAYLVKQGWTEVGAYADEAINGNKAPGSGILNNRLYIGQPEHQRQTYRRDPEKGSAPCLC